MQVIPFRIRKAGSYAEAAQNAVEAGAAGAICIYATVGEMGKASWYLGLSKQVDRWQLVGILASIQHTLLAEAEG